MPPTISPTREPTYINLLSSYNSFPYIMKHWIYNSDIVAANLRGLAASNPNVALIPSENVVFSSAIPAAKVRLISGGGAGHEPLHGGFVGQNLLDAAVSGAIFALPSTRQIMAAVRTVGDKENGTIIVVKNYTGDILHFGLVVERARAEGYAIDMVVVGDDVAVGRRQNAMVGRRGLAGTAIVHKLLGAAATAGLDLASVAALGRAAVDSLVTMGASLDRTSVPGRDGETEFTGPNEAELGLGIHNEPGTTLLPIPDIDLLVKDMYTKLVSDDPDRHYVDFQDGDETVLLVNNIGGTSSLELYAITDSVMANFPFKSRPKRVLVGDFVTSLSAPGFSITLLNLSQLQRLNKDFDAETVVSYLDAPTDAPGWKPKVYKDWSKSTATIPLPMDEVHEMSSSLSFDGEGFVVKMSHALANLISEEPQITHYDTLVGDGDCGETLVAGANAILALFKSDVYKATINDPVACILKITEAVEDSMGGTSGGIYSIYLTAVCQYFQKMEDTSIKSVSAALYSALYEGLFKYTKARIGGRTLVDTLQPFVNELNELHDFSKASKAAEEGCNSTSKLAAKFGRSSYVDKTDEIPDPGAVGLLAIIKGFK